MSMWLIKKKVLESILLAAQNTYPHEFISLLGGDRKKKMIDELVVLPATFGENFSSLRLDLVPFDEKIIGSVHSHPSPSASASPRDLRSFPKLGWVHLIVSLPFDLASARLFNAKGQELEYKLI